MRGGEGGREREGESGGGLGRRGAGGGGGGDVVGGDRGRKVRRVACNEEAQLADEAATTGNVNCVREPGERVLCCEEWRLLVLVSVMYVVGPRVCHLRW
jgi:hypothetical protein